MKIGLTQGAAALDALEQWQDQISQNIAASQVPGYKGQSTTFEGIMTENTSGEVPITADSITEGSLPQIKSAINFSQGALQETSVPTHVAIQGSGFFQVKSETGESLYTRDGQFHFNSEDILVDQSGNEVEGTAGQITQDPSKGAIAIDPEGNVIQGGQKINKIAVYEIPNLERLTRVQGGFKLPEGEAAAESENAIVAQGFVEGSNVSSIKEMINLVQVSRAYEANQKIIGELDTQYGKMIESLGTA